MAVPVARMLVTKTAADGTTDGQVTESGSAPVFNIVASTSRQ